MPTLLFVFICLLVLFSLVALICCCACRVSAKRCAQYSDLRPEKGPAYAEAFGTVLARDRDLANRPSTDTDGPTIHVNVTRVLRRKYAPYQAALLQQIEALLPITAEEDVETVFADVLLAYKKLGYNVENAGEIIAQFRKGQHPPVAGSLVNTYA